MSFELEAVNIKIFVGKRKCRSCQAEGAAGTPWLSSGGPAGVLSLKRQREQPRLWWDAHCR